MGRPPPAGVDGPAPQDRHLGGGPPVRPRRLPDSTVARARRARRTRRPRDRGAGHASASPCDRGSISCSRRSLCRRAASSWSRLSRISDMARILERHGVVPVPVDLDTGDARAASRPCSSGALTGRTRAILVAHLFGGTREPGADRGRRAPTAACCSSRTVPRASGRARTAATRSPTCRCSASGRSRPPRPWAARCSASPTRAPRPHARAPVRWPHRRSARPMPRARRGSCSRRVLARPAVYGALARLVDLDRLVAGSVRGFPGAGRRALRAARAAGRRRRSSRCWRAGSARLRPRADRRAGPRGRGDGRSPLRRVLLARAGARPGGRTGCSRSSRPIRRHSSPRCGGQASTPRVARQSIGVVTRPRGRPELEAREASETMRGRRLPPRLSGAECGRTAQARGGRQRLARREGRRGAEPLPAPSRPETLEALRTGTFDLLVVGAGIVGSRIAYEAAGAGLRVALVDAGDFGGGTSSASSKLVHGGFAISRRGRSASSAHHSPSAGRSSGASPRIW